MEKGPVIGITMGDPAGIGPEITVKAFAHEELLETCRPIVVGDATFLERAMSFPGIPRLAVHPVSSAAEALFQPGMIDVVHLGIADADTLKIGEVSKEAGNAAFRYVEEVIRLALAGEVDATVTNALNKEAMNAAGHHYSGQTEVYAKLTGTRHYAMLLLDKELRVVHVSTHVSLREACDRVKRGRVLEVIRLAHRACLDMGILNPHIGVAGLNPHCGENGLFGTEEIGEILPAILDARAEGIDADGPVPPDSIFSKARGGWYDMVVAMYHDQGHIPLKLLGFVYDREQRYWSAVNGVNITLGLPIIRTSVDHGTAFDQAGHGTASERSLTNAIECAVQFARGKKSSGHNG